MSQIPESLWREFMGNMPMPKNCTYWQFVAARDELWKQQRTDEALSNIKRLKALAVKYPKLADEYSDAIKQEIESLEE